MLPSYRQIPAGSPRLAGRTPSDGYFSYVKTTKARFSTADPLGSSAGFVFLLSWIACPLNPHVIPTCGYLRVGAALSLSSRRASFTSGNCPDEGAPRFANGSYGRGPTQKTLLFTHTNEYLVSGPPVGFIRFVHQASPLPEITRRNSRRPRASLSFSSTTQVFVLGPMCMHHAPAPLEAEKPFLYRDSPAHAHTYTCKSAS